jgi:Fe-S-cluster containining protein
MQLEADRVSQKTSKSITEFANRIENHEPYVYEMTKDEGGKCTFLKDNTCTIHQLRPLVCRFYPFELKDVGNNEHVFAYTSECPCIGKGRRLTRSYFEKLLRKSTKIMEKNAEKWVFIGSF